MPGRAGPFGPRRYSDPAAPRQVGRRRRSGSTEIFRALDGGTGRASNHAAGFVERKGGVETMIDGSAKAAAREAAEIARFAGWWTRSRRLAVLLAAITVLCAASGPFLAGRGDGFM